MAAIQQSFDDAVNQAINNTDTYDQTRFLEVITEIPIGATANDINIKIQDYLEKMGKEYHNSQDREKEKVANIFTLVQIVDNKKLEETQGKEWERYFE